MQKNTNLLFTFQHIKSLRIATKTTQKELADILNIDQGNYCNIERYNSASDKKLTKIIEKSSQFLLPKLDQVIKNKEEELKELKTIKKNLNNYIEISNCTIVL